MSGVPEAADQRTAGSHGSKTHRGCRERRARLRCAEEGLLTTLCRSCGGVVANEFRFCPWCATPQRTKLVEFFFPSSAHPGERTRALRVSRYLQEGHVRFSIWDEDVARAALSLDEPESLRLAAFLQTGREPERAQETLRDRLAAAVRALHHGEPAR